MSITHIQYTLYSKNTTIAEPFPVKKHKSHTNQVLAQFIYSITFLPNTFFKRRGLGKAVELKLQAVMTPQYCTLNTWFYRRVRFLFMIPLLSNCNNGCVHFLCTFQKLGQLKRIKKSKERKNRKLIALGIFSLTINSM